MAHGSCAVANYVYVACGWIDESGDSIEFLESIERINMKAIGHGWEELLVSSSKILSPRIHILMVGLSCDELMIIGGKSINGDFRGDGYILEIPKMCLKTAIRNTNKALKFGTYSN